MSRLVFILLFSVYLTVFVNAVLPNHDQTPLVPSRPHTTEGWKFNDCGLDTDIVALESLVVSPDPPKPGQNLTITATGTVKKTINEGARAEVAVKLGLIRLLQKTFDICEEAVKANLSIKCPVEPGTYTIQQTVALPKEIPPAKFKVEVQAYNDDDEDIMCANIDVSFLPGFPAIFL